MRQAATWLFVWEDKTKQNIDSSEKSLSTKKRHFWVEKMTRIFMRRTRKRRRRRRSVTASSETIPQVLPLTWLHILCKERNVTIRQSYHFKKIVHTVWKKSFKNLIQVSRLKEIIFFLKATWALSYKII